MLTQKGMARLSCPSGWFKTVCTQNGLSTNEAGCRVTSLMCVMQLPLSQVGSQQHGAVQLSENSVGSPVAVWESVTVWENLGS